MKSKFGKLSWIAALVLAASVLSQPSFAQNPKATAAAPSSASVKSQPGAEDRVVLRVGGQEVTQSDMDFLIASLSPQTQEAIQAQGRAPVGNEYALLLLLSQRAVADHLDTQTAIQKQLALDRMKLLAQAEYQNLAEHVQITPAEVSQYLATHKDEFNQVQIREILIRKKPAGAPANAPGLSSADAHAKMAAISKALSAGTDVQQVAKQFDMPNVVMVDTQVQTVREGQLLPALDKAAFSLKVNQVSDPIETPQALVAIQVVGHKQADPPTLSREIESILRQQKLQAEIASLKKAANIWMDPTYFGQKSSDGPAGSEASPTSAQPAGSPR